MAASANTSSSRNSAAARLHGPLLAVAGILLLAAAAGIALLKYNADRTDLVLQLEAISQVIAANTAPAISIDDRQTASRILQTLRTAPEIDHAALLLADGSTFASVAYDAAQPGAAAHGDRTWVKQAIVGQRPTHRLASTNLQLITPVTAEQEVVGFLHLRASLQQLNAHTMRLAGILGVVWLLLMGAIRFVSDRLRRPISTPIRVPAGRMPSQAGAHDDMLRAITLDTDSTTADAALSTIRNPDAQSVTASPAVGHGEAAATDETHILVVDDDLTYRLAIAKALRAAGFAVSEAGNGGQALAMVRPRHPSLILLDAAMPGMDGFETCRRLRKLPSGQDVPVIMVTDPNETLSMERAFDVGATGFTSRHLGYPVLIQRIRFTLRASQSESELRDHKAMLQIVQRVARLAYWRWDQTADRFEMSETLCAMCGIAAQEFTGSAEDFLQFVCEDDRERVRARLHAAAHERQLDAFDYRIRARHDESLIVQQDLELIPTTSGLHLLGTVQDVTRQRESEDQIRKMAYYDALTGLASRSHLMQHLEDTIKLARRRKEQFSVMFLDLDGFKDVNDTLGHDVGDFMLVSVSRRLQKVIRDIDFVARLGGDEFCILLDDNGDDLDAAEVAARCLEIINQPIDFGNQTWRPHVSIGLARFPEDGDSAGMLLKAADSAMYAAKQAGKHRYAFYRPEMTEEAELRLANEQLLRHAIEQDQFEVHYQPQIDLHNGRIVGVEALARWRHPHGDIVLPAEFVPTLERIGLVRNLGIWVVQSACAQAAAWTKAGLPEIRVAVNISPLHFHDPGILESVQTSLRETGLPAHLFEIEITESSVQSDTKAMVVLQQLRALGVRISVDDFGTGYSSLGSLKHLPIDSLKIDRVFVADMLENNEDAVMLGTIIGLAHALNYTVVAEGVEQHDQATVLAGLQCDLAQGYYFSRPVTAEEIPALLNKEPFFTETASSEPDHGIPMARAQDA